MLDALYQDRTDAVLNLPARPMPQPKAGFWDGVLSAAPRGFAIAANESARVLYRAATARADDTLRRQQQEADDFTAEAIFRRRLELDEQRAGIDASLKAGADFYRPDSNTVGVAAQVLQGAATFITKAGVYTGVTGSPLAGAALTGADVGGTEFLNLRDQGVDADTAAKVGAVRGVAAGVAAALPVAGSTLLRTAGLAATGGPAAFIGEQAAAKAILEAADYSKLADQIDPFDPIGLAAATLGATVFGAGAYALRARGRPTPTQAEVDAALIRSGEDARRRLADPTDFRAVAADEAALKRAEQQLAAGERVAVDDIARDLPPAKVQELADAVTAEVQAKIRAEGGNADPAFTARGESLNRGPLAQDAGAATGAEPAQIRAAVIGEAEVITAANAAILESRTARAAELREEISQSGQVSVDDIAGVRSVPDVTEVTGLERSQYGWTGTVRGQQITVSGGLKKKAAPQAIADEYGKRFSASRDPALWDEESGELTEAGRAAMDARVAALADEEAAKEIRSVETIGDLDNANHKVQWQAMQAYLQAIDADFTPITSQMGSRYITLRLPDGTEQKLRFADHFNVVRDTTMQPDFNVAPGRSTFSEAINWVRQVTDQNAPRSDASAVVPDVMIMRDDGTPAKAADYLREVEEQARIETEEASLIQVAAECLLEVS